MENRINMTLQKEADVIQTQLKPAALHVLELMQNDDEPSRQSHFSQI